MDEIEEKAKFEAMFRKRMEEARHREWQPTPPKRLYLWAPLNDQPRIAAWLDWKQEFGTFRYTPEWLSAEGAYALDPLNLPLADAAVEVIENRGIPGVVADAGPDSWGSGIMRMTIRGGPGNAFEEVLASAGRGAGALVATSVEDSSALSACRTTHDEPLDPIEHACWTVVEGVERDTAMDDLLRRHCKGLGGARPKAAVVVGGREVIAKLQNTKWDYWDIPRVEAACLATARHAGIDVVTAALGTANGRSVLLVDRFDRKDGKPIHYLSARSLLNAFGDAEMETLPPQGRATYAAIVAAARRIGIEGAGEEMFRRMAFNYAVGNTDDHLRNHGFLFDGAWRLAPAFDLVVIGGRAHEIGVGEDGLPRTRENVLSRVEDFGLKLAKATELLDHAVDAARTLDVELRRLGSSSKEREQVLSRLCEEART
jgi:serine/threonine-protein kinase HipA